MDYAHVEGGGDLPLRQLVRFGLAALVCALVGAVPVSVPASTNPPYPS